MRTKIEPMQIIRDRDKLNIKSDSQGDLVCGRLNCLERPGVNPLVRRVMKTCLGSSPLSLDNSCNQGYIFSSLVRAIAKDNLS